MMLLTCSPAECVLVFYRVKLCAVFFFPCILYYLEGSPNAALLIEGIRELWILSYFACEVCLPHKFIRKFIYISMDLQVLVLGIGL